MKIIVRDLVVLALAILLVVLILTHGSSLLTALKSIPGLAHAHSPEDIGSGVLNLGIFAAVLVSLVRLLIQDRED